MKTSPLSRYVVPSHAELRPHNLVGLPSRGQPLFVKGLRIMPRTFDSRIRCAVVMAFIPVRPAAASLG